MSVDILLPHFLDCKIVLPNACWVEIQNDQKNSIVLVSMPCDDVSSIVVIDSSGKRNELCFMVGAVIKIENDKLFYNKDRLDDCDSG